MNNDKYKSYDRIHKFNNPSDIESSKISKETHIHKRLSNKGDRISKQMLTDSSNLDDEMLDKYDEYLFESDQLRRTAKEHKNRLKELKKRKDFY